MRCEPHGFALCRSVSSVVTWFFKPDPDLSTRAGVTGSPTRETHFGLGRPKPRSGQSPSVLRPRITPWADSFLHSSVYSPSTSPSTESPVALMGL